MKEHSLHHDQWKWYEIDFSNEEKLKELIGDYKVNKDWLKNAKKAKTNNLRMNSTDQNRESLWGSLIYMQDAEDQDKQEIFHYYLTREFLITGQFDFSKLDNIEDQEAMKRMKNATTPMEGFMVIVNEVVADILQQVDRFEAQINSLLWILKKGNSENVLEELMHLRHELLVLKNLIIPVMEVHMGIEEAFGDEISKGNYYKKAGKRIDRCRRLLQGYQQEITTMVDLETVVSAVRGNDIMKSLTVMTILYTPMAAWGALWGMNFDFMPELNERFGYFFALLFIAVNTVLVAGYLKRKGWMGDLLKTRKNKSFFK